jgi:hypothetical protein
MAAGGGAIMGGGVESPATGVVDDQSRMGGASPAKFGGNQQEFIEAMMPHALRVSQETGLDPRLVIAQAAQETGWGRSAPNNNFFGIKSHGRAGGAKLGTHEYVNGQRVNMPDSFRTYGGMGESADDYARFLRENPRYKEMLAAGDLDGQLAALGRSGYATDPNYARSVGSIARGIQVPQGMATPAPAQGGQPAPQMNMQQFAEIMGNPYATEGQRAVAQAMLNQQMQAADPMRQMEMERARLELEQLRNPQADPFAGTQVINGQLVTMQGGQPQVLGDFNRPDPGFRTMTPEEVATVPGLDPSKAYQVGPNNEIKAVGGGGVTVNNSLGQEAGQFLYGSDGGVPPGWRVDRETGVASRIPGGPAEAEQQSQDEARGRQETLTGRQLNPTIDDIITARDLASSGIGRTGMLSSILQRVPVVGQGAVDLSATIDAIGSGISLENLNQMRQASPTGGALGNVSDKQSALLSEAFGSLRQSQSRDLFLFNLARVENTLNDIVHGEGRGPERHDMAKMRSQLRGSGPAPQPATGAQPDQPSPPDWMLGTNPTTWTNEQMEEAERFWGLRQ